MTTNSVFIFTKPNRMGVSKTRLAREIGFSEAQRLNHFTTTQVIRNATDKRWQTALMVTPERAISERQPLWPNALPRYSQGFGDLGARMSHAFALAPLGNVILLGTDIPDISRGLIASAFRELARREVVIGPAHDGGFWLYGQRKSIRSQLPFQNVRWSSEYALADVERNLGNTRISYLPTKIDLDDAQAIAVWRQSQKG